MNFIKKIIAVIVLSLFAATNASALTKKQRTVGGAAIGGVSGAVIGTATGSFIGAATGLGVSFASVLAWATHQKMKKLLEAEKANLIAAGASQKKMESVLNKKALTLLCKIIGTTTLEQLFKKVYPKIKSTQKYLMIFKKAFLQALIFMFADKQFRNKVTLPVLLGTTAGTTIAGAAVGLISGCILGATAGAISGHLLGAASEKKAAAEKKRLEEEEEKKNRIQLGNKWALFNSEQSKFVNELKNPILPRDIYVEYKLLKEGAFEDIHKNGIKRVTIKGKKFYIKGKEDECCRVKYSMILKKCIEKNNLDCLEVATKYVDPDGMVFCEAIEGEFVKKITEKEKEQIMKVVEDTGFWDFRGATLYDIGPGVKNVLRNKSGKLVFIDTEKSAFKIYANKEKFLDDFFENQLRGYMYVE